MRPDTRRRRAVLARWLWWISWVFALGAAAIPGRATTPGGKEKGSLQEYLGQLPPAERAAPPAQTSGSLWTDDSPMFMLANDAKARRLYDLVTIAVSEQTLAQATGDVTAQRDYSASSGISALAGKVNTGGISSLFSPASSTSLKGKGQSNSNSTLQTTLAGEVVAVLPNGNMVVEATRSVKMNNELRTFTLRGVIRPADVSPSDVVNSTAIAHLQVVLTGKGVVSDGTRPNNLGIRWLWKILGF